MPPCGPLRTWLRRFTLPCWFAMTVLPVWPDPPVGQVWNLPGRRGRLQTCPTGSERDLVFLAAVAGAALRLVVEALAGRGRRRRAAGGRPRGGRRPRAAALAVRPRLQELEVVH